MADSVPRIELPIYGGNAGIRCTDASSSAPSVRRGLVSVRALAVRGAFLYRHPLQFRTVTADADQFRKQAEECRQLAGTALKAVDKAFWLRLAEDWLKLAQEADKPTKRR